MADGGWTTGPIGGGSDPMREVTYSRQDGLNFYRALSLMLRGTPSHYTGLLNAVLDHYIRVWLTPTHPLHERYRWLETFNHNVFPKRFNYEDTNPHKPVTYESEESLKAKTIPPKGPAKMIPPKAPAKMIPPKGPAKGLPPKPPGKPFEKEMGKGKWKGSKTGKGGDGSGDGKGGEDEEQRNKQNELIIGPHKPLFTALSAPDIWPLPAIYEIVENALCVHLRVLEFRYDSAHKRQRPIYTPSVPDNAWTVQLAFFGPMGKPWPKSFVAFLPDDAAWPLVETANAFRENMAINQQQAAMGVGLQLEYLPVFQITFWWKRGQNRYEPAPARDVQWFSEAESVNSVKASKLRDWQRAPKNLLEALQVHIVPVTTAAQMSRALDYFKTSVNAAPYSSIIHAPDEENVYKLKQFVAVDTEFVWRLIDGPGGQREYRRFPSVLAVSVHRNIVFKFFVLNMLENPEPNTPAMISMLFEKIIFNTDMIKIWHNYQLDIPILYSVLEYVHRNEWRARDAKGIRRPFLDSAFLDRDGPSPKFDVTIMRGQESGVWLHAPITLSETYFQHPPQGYYCPMHDNSKTLSCPCRFGNIEMTSLLDHICRQVGIKKPAPLRPWTEARTHFTYARLLDTFLKGDLFYPILAFLKDAPAMAVADNTYPSKTAWYESFGPDMLSDVMKVGYNIGDVVSLALMFSFLVTTYRRQLLTIRLAAQHAVFEPSPGIPQAWPDDDETAPDPQQLNREIQFTLQLTQLAEDPAEAKFDVLYHSLKNWRAGEFRQRLDDADEGPKDRGPVPAARFFESGISPGTLEYSAHNNRAKIVGFNAQCSTTAGGRTDLYEGLYDGQGADIDAAVESTRIMTFDPRSFTLPEIFRQKQLTSKKPCYRPLIRSSETYSADLIRIIPQIVPTLATKKRPRGFLAKSGAEHEGFPYYIPGRLPGNSLENFQEIYDAFYPGNWPHRPVPPLGKLTRANFEREILREAEKLLTSLQPVESANGQPANRTIPIDPPGITPSSAPERQVWYNCAIQAREISRLELMDEINHFTNSPTGLPIGPGYRAAEPIDMECREYRRAFYRTRAYLRPPSDAEFQFRDGVWDSMALRLIRVLDERIDVFESAEQAHQGASFQPAQRGALPDLSVRDQVARETRDALAAANQVEAEKLAVAAAAKINPQQAQAPADEPTGPPPPVVTSKTQFGGPLAKAQPGYITKPVVKLPPVTSVGGSSQYAQGSSSANPAPMKYDPTTGSFSYVAPSYDPTTSGYAQYSWPSWGSGTAAPQSFQYPGQANPGTFVPGYGGQHPVWPQGPTGTPSPAPGGPHQLPSQAQATPSGFAPALGGQSTQPEGQHQMPGQGQTGQPSFAPGVGMNPSPAQYYQMGPYGQSQGQTGQSGFPSGFGGYPDPSSWYPSFGGYGTSGFGYGPPVQQSAEPSVPPSTLYSGGFLGSISKGVGRGRGHKAPAGSSAIPIVAPPGHPLHIPAAGATTSAGSAQEHQPLATAGPSESSPTGISSPERMQSISPTQPVTQYAPPPDPMQSVSPSPPSASVFPPGPPQAQTAGSQSGGAQETSGQAAGRKRGAEGEGSMQRSPKRRS